MSEVKQEVRQFYDQIGWQQVSEDVYQNARYEDLRPVSHEYIHRCHLRVARHLAPSGRFLLDAGSGPIQYPEYMTYSRDYQHRVCADISITALREARKRIGEHGLFVVADIANLPFSSQVFEGVVSLHTIHHLPEHEHLRAYNEIFRVLGTGSTAVVVNGWPYSRLMRIADPFIRFSNRLRGLTRRILGKPKPAAETRKASQDRKTSKPGKPAKGTFTNRHDVFWVKNEVGELMPVEILAWRSVSVRFLRSLIHPRSGGRQWLRLLFWFEERFPHFFGEQGQYPLIVISKE
jgi:SAM-dependent methyltransferase